MFVSFLLVLILSIVTKGTHFNGGSITWSPVNPYDNSSSVLISITQTYFWTYPTVNCSTDVPMTTAVYNSTRNTYLNCIANCSTNGNYTSKKINILTDCISSSLSLGILTGQRSVNIIFPLQTYFWLTYKGAAWRNLKNFINVTDPGWRITSLINLQRRPDGIINTPPSVQVASPQYIIVNVTSTIIISVSDVNIGDDLRCRWSLLNNSFGANECADTCFASSYLPDNTTLSNCTLSFMSTVSGVWYGFALQVEDFFNTTSTDPLSSVPIQFLIYVIPTPKCPQPPIILPITDCLEVQVNVSTTFILYAFAFCNNTLSIVNNIIPTKFINGMEIANLINSTTNTSLVYRTLTWTPLFDQIGSQQFCAVAYTNEKVQSETYCVTFDVTTSGPCPKIINSITSTTPSSESNQTSLPLIVGLSLLALLLGLCCCCCWLYHLLWSAAARRRRQNKNKKASKQQNLELPHQDRSRDYRILDESALKNTRSNVSSQNSTEIMRFSTTKTNREDNLHNLHNIKIKKSFKEENPRMKSLGHKVSDENMSYLENPLRNSRSLVTVTPLNKLTNDLQISENNQFIKSEQKEQKTNIHVIRLPKNKISSSCNTSELSRHQSTNIIHTLNGNQKKPVSHISSLNIKSDTYRRKRTSSLGGVTVRRVKTMDNTNNRLSRLLVKKE